MKLRPSISTLRVSLALSLAAVLGGRPVLAQDRPTEAPVDAAPRVRAPRPVQMVPVGTFFASLIDREALPVTDRVVDEDGTIYLIEFDRMVLTLRADFTFRASVRYRRTLFSADPRGRARATPLQSTTVSGRWDIGGTLIRFFPDESTDSRGLRIMAGTVASLREMTVPFHYRNGTQERERTLVLRRRDNIL